MVNVAKNFNEGVRFVQAPPGRPGPAALCLNY